MDENGNLINGDKPSINILKQIQFYGNLDVQLSRIDKQSESGEYILSGITFITDYWTNQKEDIKISEVYIGLSIARNRVLTASLLN